MAPNSVEPTLQAEFVTKTMPVGSNLLNSKPGFSGAASNLVNAGKVGMVYEPSEYQQEI